MTMRNAYAKFKKTMVHHDSQKSPLRQLPRLTPLIAASVVVVGIVLAPVIKADSYDEQIKLRQKEQSAAQAQSDVLAVKAEGIQGVVDGLRNQIAVLQSQIDVNTTRHTELTKKIEEAKKKLEEQRTLLASSIRSMTIEGDISPLEMLATSKNISDFVDKQEYRNRIKENITTTVDEIERLRKQLDEQRLEVTRILNEQKRLRGQVASKEAEASANLAQVNQTKAGFDAAVQQKASEIASLRAQQRAANLAAFGGGVFVASGNGGGGYPYDNVGYPCWGGGGCTDPWGLYKRECVSYTAFKVQQAGKRMPYFGGRGHASQWPGTASSFGIPSGSAPRAQSVAISYAGPYGHAMWVEAVLPDGRIHVSEYNFGVDGRYSERIISPGGLTFIYF